MASPFHSENLLQIININAEPNTKDSSLFLEEPRGLFDSIHRPHQQLHDYYKKLKDLDWDENEFELNRCSSEIAGMPYHIVDKLVSTIAWQWESDTMAAQNLSCVAMPYVTSHELMSAYVEINKNEILHALSYSEITKYGFPDPLKVMSVIQQKQDAHDRLETVGKVFAYVKRIAGQLMCGMMKRTDPEARKAALLFSSTMFIMERGQFMGTFLTSFGVGELGYVMPIINTIQKIFTDEYTIHIPVNRYVMEHELSLPINRPLLPELHETIELVLNEVIEAELKWNHDKFFLQEELPGITRDLANDWTYYAETDIRATLGLGRGRKTVTKNPAPFMDKWSDINNQQGTPQELRGGNYLLGGFVKDAGDMRFKVEGL